MKKTLSIYNGIKQGCITELHLSTSILSDLISERQHQSKEQSEILPFKWTPFVLSGCYFSKRIIPFKS